MRNVNSATSRLSETRRSNRVWKSGVSPTPSLPSSTPSTRVA
ncbi:expressed unknown protein [Ectocarpus siliculosus]|uniref:Uncharacterized protein n=1 Tax=Ectocarpus siliculosus TaxID=2880 RepID=D8LK64_ECTSI|nr:expressed unknown protein [Ectocarpus siliculosus]|eukprot:CBN76028.1 expressed unknown protein [Ectocarpus siliculosus]